MPIWAACITHKTPFQKGDDPTSGQQKILGFFVLYLKSTILVQMELEFKWYLKIQELRRAMFRLLKSGTPGPPTSFF
jgi:hypothetical protein